MAMRNRLKDPRVGGHPEATRPHLRNQAGQVTASEPEALCARCY